MSNKLEIFAGRDQISRAVAVTSHQICRESEKKIPSKHGGARDKVHIKWNLSAAQLGHVCDAKQKLPLKYAYPEYRHY